jgi:hypothetical protein
MRLTRCARGATAAEFAVILGLVVIAAGSAQSPRIAPVKDRACAGPRCLRAVAPQEAARLRPATARQKPAKFRSFER